MGGVTRVRIQSAEDIRHLEELDKKMWTVLSCPVNGLEISAESLSLMDQDSRTFAKLIRDARKSFERNGGKAIFFEPGITPGKTKS